MIKHANWQLEKLFPLILIIPKLMFLTYIQVGVSKMTSAKERKLLFHI